MDSAAAIGSVPAATARPTQCSQGRSEATSSPVAGSTTGTPAAASAVSEAICPILIAVIPSRAVDPVVARNSLWSAVAGPLRETVLS